MNNNSLQYYEKIKKIKEKIKFVSKQYYYVDIDHRKYKNFDIVELHIKILMKRLNHLENNAQFMANNN